jgi:1-deoxy-D-xylulose-5-phosphate synthase
MGRYLDRIECPDDLKELSIDELEELAREIRERIISVVSVNGGHLASSLGAVEIILSLHYVFNCPRDKIIWDVGHQTYAHKIITGRNKDFETLRKEGGLGGFPRIEESEYDCFGTGHASTAISAALGMACARDLRGGNKKVIAYIGDGSLTGGLCYEALNNAGHRARNLIVVLNDNEMSISRNVGAISVYLNKIISSQVYNRVRNDMQLIIKRIPAVGKRIFDTARRLEESLKNLVAPGMLFEELGFRYFGPVEGHNIRDLIRILMRLRDIEQPVILHVLTRKGKGYVHAEQHPEYFHGTSPFDIKTGKPIVESEKQTFTNVFGKTVIELAREDPAVCAITAAMSFGTGLDAFAEEFPGRFFDVGIAEQHAVTFAAGLSISGLKPVVAVYATFLQRAYDQIIHDVCLQKLPVVFAVDRSGIVGADGATHSGQFIISSLRLIPNLILMEPADADELRAMLRHALQCGMPSAVIYPKESAEPFQKPEGAGALASGTGLVLRSGSDVSLIAIGPMVRVALEVAGILAKGGREAAVINARFIKPLDEKMIIKAARESGRVVTLEENSLRGGFGSAVLELFSRRDISGVRVLCIGIGDEYVEQGARKDIAKALGLDADSIARRVIERFWP